MFVLSRIEWQQPRGCWYAVSKGNRLKVRPCRMAMAADRVVPDTCSTSCTAFRCVERNTASGDGSVLQVP